MGRAYPVKEDNESNEALMAAYVRGDGSAFERLFQRLAPRVHGFFLRTFRQPTVADDLLQTTFLKLHRARAEYRPDRPLRPWLFTIAARVRLDELRRRRNLPEDADEETLARTEDTRAEPAASNNASATTDRADAVREALGRLPESQRVIILLHRYEGLTFPEIARALAISEGAVKLRAFRAYERLRVELRPLLEEKA